VVLGHSAGRILEALYVDPAATAATSGALTSDWDRTHRELKAPPSSASSASAIAKLSKPAAPTGTLSQKPQAGDQKETPQERLKRIMSKQLNKQIKKDTVTEAAKRREQEKERQEKLAETRRIAQRKHHNRSESRSPKRLI
jgi:arginine/serine-rich splicing factor 16